MPSLTQQIRRVLGSVEILETTSSASVSRIAQHAADRGADVLVSLGGDGTHSAVADGILRSGRANEVSLGVLHAGTGGDFRKLLFGNQELSAACEAVVQREATAIDVGYISYRADAGELEYRYFINIVTAGIGGLVDQFVARATQRLGGSFAYLSSTLRAQLQYEAAEVTLHLDGKPARTESISAIAVCNARWAGGGMHFAPAARLTDGLFDVVTLRGASIPRGLPVLVDLYRGKLSNSSLVQLDRAREVRVTVNRNTAWMDIDGDAPGVAPFEARVVPRALRVIGVRPEFL